MELDAPLLCGHDVLEAGTRAVVETVFPKFRIRGERQARAATVEFDDVARVLRRVPTIDLSETNSEGAISIAFDVDVLED
jgi:hypothetical protein